MKILVADDDATLRTELMSLLEEDGHQVVPAADGGEAIRLIEREGFDVALLDLKMPKATGLEILHRLRIVSPQTAAVMITGQGTIDVAVEAMKAGAVDFLEKPYDVDVLQRTLRTVAEEREARSMLRSDSAPDVRSLLSEAAARKALLAVLGPAAKPPLNATRVLEVDEEAAPPNVFSPSQLYHLNAAIDEHIGRVDQPVVFAADLSLLERVHGREDVKAWIRHVSGRCRAKGGALVLASISPDLASEIRSERDAADVSPGLQAMLESLANPIRRAVVGFVFSSGPVAYSTILKQNYVDSSSKLSFHLQKLQTDGLLAKVEGGRYSVTEAGTKAWRVVRAISEGQRHPSLVVSTS